MAGGNQCSVNVDIDGSPVISQWYDLWAGAVAITGICVMNDKTGVSSTLGLSQNNCCRVTRDADVMLVGSSKITVAMRFPPNA